MYVLLAMASERHIYWCNITIDWLDCNVYIPRVHSTLVPFSFKSIQMLAFSQSRSEGQHASQGKPDVPLPSHVLQLFLGFFQHQVGYIIPPEYSGSQMQMYVCMYVILFTVYSLAASVQKHGGQRTTTLVELNDQFHMLFADNKVRYVDISRQLVT